MKKKYIHLLISIVIIVLSLAYAFQGVKFSTLLEELSKANYLYLIPAVILIMITYLFRAMRWHYLLRPIKDVPVKNIFSPLFIGFMANMLPARAGELIRAYLLGKREDISFSTAFATIFVERLFDMSMVLLMLFSITFFYADVISQSSPDAGSIISKIVMFGWMGLAFSLFMFAFMFFLLHKNELAMKAVRLFIRPLPDNWGLKIVEMVNAFTQGLNILKDIKGFLMSILLSFLIWVCITLTCYPIYHAFGFADMLPALSSLLILNLFVAFSTLFPAPGFLGPFQAACVFVLHEIFKIPKAAAASYGIALWITSMGFTIIVGIIFAMKDNVSMKELSEKSEGK
ncbi:MAG: lysylphosphatidylglycerol synthase transmembrane domain-containing protein [Thermodesulfovibrionia bacterium]|nr:lysylphosphatidylglycerol synthase transmembrane domain-containing protein [Thermodesulfovibrionia bacterium]